MNVDVLPTLRAVLLACVMPSVLVADKVPVAVVAQLQRRAVHQRHVGPEAATEPPGLLLPWVGLMSPAVDVSDTLPVVVQRPICVTFPVVCGVSVPRWMPRQRDRAVAFTVASRTVAQAECASESVGGLVSTTSGSRPR